MRYWRGSYTESRRRFLSRSCPRQGEAKLTPTRSGTRHSIRRHVFAGMAVFALLITGVGGWAGTAPISGALIASGSVVVDFNGKKIQHPTRGGIGELLVRDGDRVKASDVVARLDQTITRANLAIVVKGLNEFTARKARLTAERDGAESIIFPQSIMIKAVEADVAQITEGERRLF